MEKIVGEKAWEMEQLFDNGNVFVNAIKNTPASMDSYMTVLDYTAFYKTWKEIKDKFTKEDWLDSCEYWISQGYVSPMCGLLGRTVKRQFD